MTFRTLGSVLLIAVAASLAQATHASEYIAIEGISGNLENPSNQEIDPLGFRLRLGTRIDNTFDLETQFGYLNDGSTDSFKNVSAAFAGAYLKGYLPVGENSAFFALAGVTAIELTQKAATQTFTDSRAGFSYGVGLKTQISENADLTADYMRYIADDGLFENISAVSFGIKLYF